MPAQCGKAIVVSVKNDAGSPAYVVVAGLRTRSISFNSETVDVTSADSTNSWRELLSGCGVMSASMKGDGIFTDDAGFEVIRDAVFDRTSRDGKILVPGLGTFEGQWRFSSLEVAGEYNKEVTFSFGLESAGEITFALA